MDNNYIFQYWEAIQNGTVTVGKWIRTIYKILVDGLKSGKWDYDEGKAEKAIKFIENFCHHSEGRNDLLKLELWQKAIVSAIFGIMDKKTGYRQFREVFIVVARKNGKTLFAAAIAAYMTYIDGEYGAKVYFLAPKLDQAELVYDAFYQIVQADDELDSITKKRRSDIYIKEFNTSVKKIAFNSKKSDGFNPQMVVNDEMEAWPGDQGLKQYEVMTSALGARKQPLILSISTAGYINDGIYDELMRRATSFLKGNSKETRILPFLYMIDDIEKWDSIEELKKSNPNLGVSVSEEFYIEQIEIARASLSKKVEFLTKYCNIKQNSSVAWLDYWDVMKAVNEDICISLEEYRAFREHVEKRRGVRRPDAGPDKRDGIPFYPPAERKEIPPPPPPAEGVEMPMVEIRTVGRKRFMVAPGLFLLTRNMLLQNYDANGNGHIDPEEHAVVMKDAAALYQAKMKEMMELYDLDQDGVLSPVEREQALADSHKDSPLYAMEEPDDIDLFIRANISEVLLKESPVDAGDDKDKGTE